MRKVAETKGNIEGPSKSVKPKKLKQAFRRVQSLWMSLRFFLNNPFRKSRYVTPAAWITMAVFGIQGTFDVAYY